MAKKYDSNKYKLIDIDTGEFVNFGTNLIELEDGDSYKTKTQNDYYKTHITFGKGETFVKVYDRAGQILKEKFKDDNATRLLIYDLARYVSYDNNILKINGHFATIADIARDMEKDKSTLSKAFKKLILNGIVAKATVGKISGDEKDLRTVYIVNPYIYMKGQEILTSVVNLFDETGWDKI